jgi:hypothetical protein
MKIMSSREPAAREKGTRGLHLCCPSFLGLMDKFYKFYQLKTLILCARHGGEIIPRFTVLK